MIYFGTSGIVVPGTKQSFPEEYQDKSRLHFYSSFCNSIEINSSFYKIPLRKTFEKWAAEVPGNFRFTIKLWREITHRKNLEFDRDSIRLFTRAAEGLGEKKGCLLVQLPGKISLDYYSKVEEMLRQLAEDASGWRIAVELRNESWYISETFELLDYLGASLVMHDKSKGKIMTTNRKPGFIYMRFHGPDGNYRGSYTDLLLREKAEEIREYKKQGKEIFIYFNNTMGAALENLLTLKGYIRD